MPPHVFAAAGQHTAEILRPRGLDGGVDDHPADMASAEMLRLRRKAEERIDLSVREELNRWRRCARDPTDVVDGVEPDMSGHHGDEHMMARLQAGTPTFLPFKSAI
jgi:hypothetical protein